MASPQSIDFRNKWPKTTATNIQTFLCQWISTIHDTTITLSPQFLENVTGTAANLKDYLSAIETYGICKLSEYGMGIHQERHHISKDVLKLALTFQSQISKITGFEAI